MTAADVRPRERPGDHERDQNIYLALNERLKTETIEALRARHYDLFDLAYHGVDAELDWSIQHLILSDAVYQALTARESTMTIRRLIMLGRRGTRDYLGTSRARYRDVVLALASWWSVRYEQAVDELNWPDC